MIIMHVMLNNETARKKNYVLQNGKLASKGKYGENQPQAASFGSMETGLFIGLVFSRDCRAATETA